MRSLLVGSIFAFMLTGCGCPRSGPPEPVVNEPAVPAPADWSRYTTADGSCSAAFPGKPTIEAGGIWFEHPEVRYSLTYTRTPPEFAVLSDEEILTKVRNAPFLGEVSEGFQLVEEEKLALQGALGHRWHYRSRSDLLIMHILVKVVVRNGEIFLLSAYSGFTDKYAADMKFFLDSFQFENAKP